MIHFTLLFVSLIVVARCVDMPQDLNDFAQIERSFAQFETKFAKSYRHDRERARRLKTFAANLNEIQTLNAQRKDENSAVFGIGPFADLSKSEVGENVDVAHCYIKRFSQLKPFQIRFVL
jgi:hypothetical protein